MTTIGMALALARSRLGGARIDSAGLEARLLAAEAWSRPMTELIGHPDYVIDDAEVAALETMVARRVNGQPVAYILGRKEFWSRTFHVSRDTLIPRPETETLIEAVLAAVGDHQRPLTILDLGTGSGCILLTLLAEMPNARGVGVDVAERSVRMAEMNARLLNVAERARWIIGNWSDAIGGTFDIIVSNPPYIAMRDRQSIPRDVAEYEPSLALLAGEDGLDAYRQIIPALAPLLRQSGGAFLEIGAGQEKAVAALLRQHAFQHIELMNDLAGRARCIAAYPAYPVCEKKALGTQEVPD